MQHRDGSWRFVEAVANNLLHQPEINGIVVTLHDITERKLAEEEQSRLQASLQRSETMAAMGTLVSGVAHEVRNPLFSISATLDALEAKFQHQADHQPYLQALRGETDRLNRLMNDLLQYGKPRQLELTKVSLRKVVEEATQSCQPLAQQQQITISNLLSEEFNLNADEERLHQVFKNLIENALQHSAKGSSVEINAERAAAEHAVTCTVRDHGNGFLPEDLGKVFDPFYSRRKGGTGLGLSIVQRIIEEHKGQITTSNHPDGGAVISVTLPLAG
jgi:signal transduction histidine kinase